MRRLPALLLLAVGLAVGMVLVNPSVALACSCVTSTAEQHTNQADTVAIGTVGWVSTNGIDRTYSVNFSQVYKGAAGLTEKVLTPDSAAACGVGDLAINEQYVFFLQGKHPGQMKMNSCGGTTKVDALTLDAVQKVTGPPVPPFPSFESGPTVPAGSTDPVRVVGIGGLALGALAGIVLAIRRRVRGGSRRYLG